MDLRTPPSTGEYLSCHRPAIGGQLRFPDHPDPAIVLANAGIFGPSLHPFDQSEAAWQDNLDVNLTGTWNTLQLTAPILMDQGEGGSIVITSSSATGRWITTNFDGGVDGYCASKHALVALMTAYAGRLAENNIRVNTFHPTGVTTPMVANEHFAKWVAENPRYIASWTNALPMESMDPIDASRVFLFLVGDAGRFITGQQIFVDAGQTAIPPVNGGTQLHHKF